VKDAGSPIVAAARTRHAGAIISYLFAFVPSGEPRTVRISSAALGYSGPVYAYNYFEGFGRFLEPSDTHEFTASEDGSYWIVVPLGGSGVAFLGDAGKFVSMARTRIVQMHDSGTLAARIVLSEGETRLRLFGFARAQPNVRAVRASIDNLAYDSRTGLFHFDLVGKPRSSPEIRISATSSPDARGSPPR